MKHKHSELIKAWADDINLIILSKCQWEGAEWVLDGNQRGSVWYESQERFLTYKKHVDVCLAWLNGAEVEYKEEYKRWLDIEDYDPQYPWTEHDMFMSKEYNFRVKPAAKFKSIKVWVGVCNRSGSVTTVKEDPLLNREKYPTAFSFTWTECLVDKGV